MTSVPRIPARIPARYRTCKNDTHALNTYELRAPCVCVSVCDSVCSRVSALEHRHTVARCVLFGRGNWALA